MAVTPALIKELRELTGSGMSDCKKALEETGGDIKKAVEFLREKGLAAAEKKSGRIAAEGVVALEVVPDFSKAAMVEVNSETDFVAINPDFKAYVADVAAQVLTSTAPDTEAFLAEKWAKDESQTVQEFLKGKIATIGENLNIRRFVRYEKTTPGVISSYVHGGGKIGVLLEIDCEKDSDVVKEMGYNLCMQIAALFPKYLRVEDVDQEYLEAERKILDAAAKNDPANASKPAQVIEKMVEGRINKQMKEICLLEQEYVKDTQMTVKAYVDSVAKEVGAPVTLVRFACFERGAGIEKKQEDFAEEVAKAMQG
ncbi:MAG: translation elongation factor Ts [Defluviitaleaceae bacterium]|nr:translation elongation factor Ts [Defluviitaleaceae bacterium]